MISVAQKPTLHYFTFNESFTEQLVLSPLKSLSFDGEKTYSAHKQGSFWIEPASFSEKPPWTSQLYIQHTNISLQLSILNHANSSPGVSWINDELLFISVWWGRVTGTELILDLSKGEFVYKRMFFYDLSSSEQDIFGESNFPELEFKLEHIQGAPLTAFDTFELLSFSNQYDSVRQLSFTTLPPVTSNCFVEATLKDIQAIETFLQDILKEQLDNAPPHPIDTVCSDCTSYRISWTYKGNQGSFEYSEQHPFRYPAMDDLFLLINDLLERMKNEVQCDA